MTAKRQHYVPRGYLAAFTDPATPAGQEPYIWVYERETAEPYARSPRKLAVRTHYYSFATESGELDTTVEEFLSKIESTGIRLIQRLIAGEAPDSFTEEDRGALAYFIALMSVRIPGFRDSVEKFAADVMRKVALVSALHPEHFERTMREAYAAKGEKPPENIEVVRQFVLSGEYELITSPLWSLQALIELAPTGAQYIYRYQWRILRASTGVRFITSDNPLVLVSTEKLPAPYNWGTGWETPWMEATLPLSPDTCLLISLHHPQGIEAIHAGTVNEINLRTASYATEAVYSSVQIDPRTLNRPPKWVWWEPVTAALITGESSNEPDPAT
jgi:hypothetical protein